MPKRIEISHKTIIFTVFFLLFLWFIVQIAEIISWIFISFILPALNIDLQNFTQQISALGQNLLKLSVGIFNNIISFFTIFVITFYLLLERKNLDSYLITLL